jgi:hypothetical protein
MEQHSTVPTHRRQSSDPPGGFDFASVLQQFGNEEMKVEEGELMTKDGICFKTVAAAAVEAAAATGEVIDKSILENELWRTMNEGANNKRSRVEEWGVGAAVSGRRNSQRIFQSAITRGSLLSSVTYTLNAAVSPFTIVQLTVGGAEPIE